SATSDDVTQKDEILSISSQIPGGDFVLSSSQGKFSLEQLRGKVVLLFFGYTQCPDVCPTSLSLLAQALNELSEDELQSVQAVFVSVDPMRDTFKVLDEYVSYFHPNLTGITGSESEIAEVAKRYGAQYEEVALEGSSFGYAVNHSAETYMITPEGELRFMFPHQTPSFVILEAIRYLLASQ
ncbi:MAG: SCO family protein, partial [Candidatus Thiodiazotropha sp. (ex Semelilucina semeliformis)]|nr:SCO family protein [Candidatus Thiodiazotropha sp. (ex Semelilucina semeliformis)]